MCVQLDGNNKDTMYAWAKDWVVRVDEGSEGQVESWADTKGEYEGEDIDR